METIATATSVLDTPTDKTKAEQQVFYRLTALWAISEAFLGGVLHAFKLPGTGLFVGGAAVICISLIAWYCPRRSDILKATILVILIKGMLSPHSPVGAYLAVFIQGSLGYLLFWSRSYFRLSCFALGILAQLQSALQRLVVLVIVFGSDIYGIANGIVNYILKKAGFATGDYVFYIILMYVGLHLLMGIAVGWFAGKLPAMVEKAKGDYLPAQKLNQAINEGGKYDFKKKVKKPYRRYALVLLSSSFLILNTFNIIVLPAGIFEIILRAISILLVWYFFITPVLMAIIKKWSGIGKHTYTAELQIILKLIPDIKEKILLTWEHTSHLNYLKRLSSFSLLLLTRLLHQN